MSSTSPRQHCWLILTSTSADETAKLIDDLEKEDPATLNQVASIKICRNNWRQSRLSEHDFMHRVKATIENEIGVTVRQEANQLIHTAIQRHRKI